MAHVEIRITEPRLPPDAVPMARHELTTGSCLDLTLDEWTELHAWLDLGQRCGASVEELRRMDERAP